MTSEQVKMVQELSNKIRRFERVIYLLKNTPKWDCADFENRMITLAVYDNKNEVLPIFENKLKELNEKLNNL